MTKTLLLEGELADAALAIKKNINEMNTLVDEIKNEATLRMHHVQSQAEQCHNRLWARLHQLTDTDPSKPYSLNSEFYEEHGHVYLVPSEPEQTDDSLSALMQHFLQDADEESSQ